MSSDSALKLGHRFSTPSRQGRQEARLTSPGPAKPPNDIVALHCETGTRKATVELEAEGLERPEIDWGGEHTWSAPVRYADLPGICHPALHRLYRCP